jgi:hypothetical protein
MPDWFCMVRIFTPDKNVDMERLCAVDGKQIGAVQSKDLCRAFFDMYIGDPPVSVETKQDIAQNVGGLIRRCY